MLNRECLESFVSNLYNFRLRDIFKTWNFIAYLSHHCPRILEILMSFLYVIRYQMKYRITAICVPRLYPEKCRKKSLYLVFFLDLRGFLAPNWDVGWLPFSTLFLFQSFWKKTPVEFLHIRNVKFIWHLLQVLYVGGYCFFLFQNVKWDTTG